jgi:hypothetical protein
MKNVFLVLRAKMKWLNVIIKNTMLPIGIISTKETIHKINADESHISVIKPIGHFIDTDADPFSPNDWEVERHVGCGIWKLDFDLIELFSSEKQEKGYKLKKVVNTTKGKNFLNANVLDYLLDYPTLIPESWKGKKVFFWNTIYRYSCGEFCVRYLSWNGSEWDWHDYRLGSIFAENNFAALAS